VTTLDIDSDTAREAAERELSKPMYPRPSPKQQFLDFVETLIRRLVLKGAELPGGWFTIAVLLIILAAGVVAAVHVGRRMLRDGRRSEPLYGRTRLSAAEHRAAAQDLAAAADWGPAIRHRLRAVARGLEEAGLVLPASGRTASELARVAGAALPGLADDLIRAAETFNDVTYGEVPATAQGYRIVADLDERVAATTGARPLR
jgi:hypothetical protein